MIVIRRIIRIGYVIACIMLGVFDSELAFDLMDA